MKPEVRTTLEMSLAKRILVLDGAMGTMIQRHDLSEADFRGDRFRSHSHDLKGDNDVLVLTRPDVIVGIHREYLAAGSDIIETNTFNSTAVAQADYGLESIVYELNLEGARLAVQACAEWTARTHARPFSVGLNCALGARDMRPYLAELARIADCYVSCYPNAGLPNAFGQYDEQPRDTSAYLREFATSGFVNIVGGCCGTTPEHIGAIARAGDGVAPRPIHHKGHDGHEGHKALASFVSSVVDQPADNPDAHYTQFAGLEPLTIRPDSNFQMIGERTNVTGSVRFARLIRWGNYADAAKVALDQ